MGSSGFSPTIWLHECAANTVLDGTDKGVWGGRGRACFQKAIFGFNYVFIWKMKFSAGVKSNGFDIFRKPHEILSSFISSVGNCQKSISLLFWGKGNGVKPTAPAQRHLQGMNCNWNFWPLLLFHIRLIINVNASGYSKLRGFIFFLMKNCIHF